MKCRCDMCDQFDYEIVGGNYHCFCQITETEWGDEYRIVEDCPYFNVDDGACFRG